MRSERLAQALLQPTVDLHHVQVADLGRQALGEHAEPAADLQHDVIGPELGQPLDHVEDVAVDQEVLPELPSPRLVRPHHPNTAAAARSIERSSSAYSTRRSHGQRLRGADHVGRLVRLAAHDLRR